ncbi:MAG: glycoside hydrolase family 88 protein [Marinilabiliaceae bacterium]|nr:glycoside hydrolase family 88 protein [Marinilabiliaceae bacterium]
MKLNRFVWTIALVGFIHQAVGAVQPEKEEQQPDWVTHAFKVIEGQAKGMLKEVKKTGLTPRSIERGLRPSEDWTSGFYPGILWYLYEYTGKDQWCKEAAQVTAYLEKEQYSNHDHDIGFRIYCSYGNGYLLTQEAHYKQAVVNAAKALSTRYNEKTQTIMSWNPNEQRDWKYPVIIDNMMNLELLFEATRFSGDNSFTEIAIKHAQQTMKFHYRSDFSCPHVVDYDPATGAFRRMDYNNGFCDPKRAAWSRGQSWGLYGYTLMYRETSDSQYLAFAENIAAFLLDHPNMPEDMVPYWDYHAPKIPTMRDASAAAIMASAFLELSTYAEDGNRYFKAAEKILKSLSSEQYLAHPGTNGHYVLKHATGNYLNGSEVDGTLIYADYYYVEALLRYLKIINDQPLFTQSHE